MNRVVAASQIETLSELYDVLPEYDFEPLWTMKGALTKEPATAMAPVLWRYSDVRELILRAGDLISAEDADRRVLAFKNPGCTDHEMARATDTLWAAVQLVLPGEVAPPHRHSAAALRYIIEGEGGFTAVDGRRIEMERGDFVLTPNWTWHEHGNSGTGPMLWLDGLDLPMVNTLKLVFTDFDGPEIAPRPLPPASVRTGELLPRWDPPAEAPTLVWKLADAEEALEAYREEEGSPFDDLIVEYRNPATNGPAMPTMSASVQLLRPGVRTRAHQHTSSHVYHVIRGTGSTTISGQVLEWGPGDTFALPTWAEHHHENESDADALLFSFSDRPSVEALGLFRASGTDG